MKKLFRRLAVLACIILSGIAVSLPFTQPLAPAQLQTAKPAENISASQQESTKPSDCIIKLSLLKGREAGTKFEKKAATLLAREFVTLGLDPICQANNFYFQPFLIPEHRTSYYVNNRLKFMATGPYTLSSQNVLGLLPGTSDRYLLFSAHYDGQGINHSQIYPSGNDNLSGVATLLMVAQRLETKKERYLNYVFIAFGAEEIGLYGSTYFAEHLPFPPEKIVGVINLDTLSTTTGKAVIHTVKKNDLVELVQDHLRANEVESTVHVTDHRTTDHYPFGQKNIPSLSILAFDWLTNNHTPQDTLNKVDFSHLNLIVKSLTATADTLEERIAANEK